MPKLKVFASPCKNCLFSKDRIVPPERASEVIRQCIAKDKHFTCHVATIEGQDIVCRAFYDQAYDRIRGGKLIKALEENLVEFVPMPEGKEELLSWTQSKRSIIS